ncbi:MAG: hypothetical protein KIT65_10970 [Xanthobacteraceae bacterium]|nr:hypothetical protein [Xanthobacteraceae bacterium]
MAKQVTGIEQTLANLNKEIKGVKGRTMGGLLAAGLKDVQRPSQKKVPVEYNKLRASAYTKKAQDGELAVDVGYSAAYALFVHENLEQKLKGKPRPSGLGVYWGPDGEPKFLERTVTENQDAIVKTVADHEEVK